MMTYVTYDARSGQIISVHHGATDQSQVRQRAHQHSKIGHEHIGVITVQPEAAQRGKRYKVDVSRKALVEAGVGEGVGFSFGVIARLPVR
jgi:hypothetical protein